MGDDRRGRRLTGAERKRLDALERALAGEDPALADALRSGRPGRRRLPAVLVGAVAAGAGLLIALAALVGGAGAAAATALSVLATAALWEARRRRANRPGGTAAPPTVPPANRTV